MDRSVKAPGGGDISDYKELIAVCGAVGLGEAASASLRLGELLYGAPEQDGITWQPLDLAIRMMTGEVEWSAAATGGAVTLLAGTVAGVAGTVWAWRAGCAKCRQLTAQARRNRGSRKRIRREAVDAQAQYMAKGRELDDLGIEAVREKADKLKVRLRDGDAPGVLIARSVVDGRDLYASYEDLHIDIWGPRTGKSTTRVIPAVLEAVGAVVATSNKRDVVDATRDARRLVGDVHVFDPQGVAEEECSWYWDPIAWVLGDGEIAGAQERAAQLAGHFAAAGDSDGRDSFFDTEGEDLLGGLFLACALDKEPITKAFEWVTRPTEPEPVEVLKRHGLPLLARALADQFRAPDKQRSGVFSTAKKMAACLKMERIRPWVTPPAEGERPRRSFDVVEFVASRDTLYPLSQEGRGGAGALVTALCAAVAEAGKREGARHPGGRLPVPLLMVLDEAANIVRWRELPAQYSHFGSRGLVVMAVLQSWAQGVRCWGSEGMSALWGAANVKVLGAGLDDAAFLRDRSELIGPHHELVNSTSRSTGKGNTSRSVSTQRTTEITLHASDLASLPKGRVVVFTSGHRPTLAATVPWWERPYGARVQAALDERSNPQPATGRAHLRAVPPWIDIDEEGETA